MKPLVTTVRALRELATGIAPDAVVASSVLYNFESRSSTFLLSLGDTLDSQRVVFMRENNVRERYVPEHLTEFRRDVLSRMASFAERARTRPLSLPRGWHQYKHHNLVAFYAVPGGDRRSTRWIAEVKSDDRADVFYWHTTTSATESTLEEFAASDARQFSIADIEWEQAFEAASQYFSDARRPDRSDIDMHLPALAQSPTKGWTYEHWTGAVGDDQSAFIEAPTDKSIRLRGPAGSGKTIALTLKAIREVLRAREAGEEIRVLIATHSWGLAAQISDSIDVMGLGKLNEIDVFPLLEIAQTVLPPQYKGSAGFTLIGEDSYSAKQAQLDEIVELIEDFVEGNWVTYRSRTSQVLRDRIESTDGEDRLALAWDLLIEFGSVIGAAAIFPGVGAELRYFQLQRATWMLPLETNGDLIVVFALYSKFMENLEERSLMTSDQVLADFLSYLVTHAWNRSRKTKGYDLVFVDEFHLFSPLERQVLHYLTRDVAHYPRIFMAVDPRQSPSEAFIGTAADQTRSSMSLSAEHHLGDITNLELMTIHRFTPQILDLIKHVHHEFPTLDLGHDWDVDFSTVESARDDGPLPRLITVTSRSAEETDIYRAVREVYGSGRIALAVVDMRQWRRFSKLASQIAESGKFHVSIISGRTDIEGLGYRRRGLAVGPAEYLAGLQFETVLVAGIPDLPATASTANEKTRMLSLLYLALSRAECEIRIFVNEDDGGAPEVLIRAVANGLVESERGSEA